MPLKPATLDVISTKLTEMTASMCPEDIEGLKARITQKLGAAEAETLLRLIDEEDGEPATEPLAATGAVARMARAQGKVASSPEVRSGSALLASAGAYGMQQGEPFADKWALAESMTATLNSLGPGWRGKHLVASAKFEYPEERRLDDSLQRTERLIDAVCGVQALLASGGICSPTNVDYGIPTWATAERPLRDGIASFEATRGGVRFVTPPDIAEWEGATGIWTEATDAEPGSSTKPVVVMTCGEEQVVYVEAVSTRIGFGNMQSRFAPEQVAANTDLAAAAAARIAENNLLKLIAEKCVQDITSTKALGATRDLLTVLDMAVANHRQTHRLPDELSMTVILPRWVRDLIRADLAREIGHAQNDYFNALAVTDDDIMTILRARGVNPIFHLDGQASTAKFPNQYFTAPAAEAEYHKFPTKMVWYMFPEGSFQFLDGGRLDLGVVRDSTLDATNDFETFIETFEGIAWRGFKNGALQFVTELCPSGGSTGTVTAACP
jgi:hypothetical protein